MIGGALAWLVVAALIAIGLAGLAAPRRASAQYGIATDDPRALGLVRAMAARDVALGGLLGVLALVASHRTIGWAMWLVAPIAVVDVLVVAADRRAHGRPLGWTIAPHAGGVAGLLAVGALLIAGC